MKDWLRSGSYQPPTSAARGVRRARRGADFSFGLGPPGSIEGRGEPSETRPMVDAQPGLARTRPETVGDSDESLLARFAQARDPAALEALVRRHGPMVLALCRRILRHEQDAEDAFQATFLVLVRRAATLRDPRLLSNWLYGVAFRIAHKARAARRTEHERHVP